MPGTNASGSIFVALNLSGDASAPEWIQILPAGPRITGDDGRVYDVPDMAALARKSLAETNGRLPIDENHSTDLAAPRGEPSPARAWMTDLEARKDGLWAKVQWTEAGRQLVADRAYAGISPALAVPKADKDKPVKRVTAVLRASLCNAPNFSGMAALNATGAEMEEVLAKLRQMLGLPADAENDAIWDAIRAVIDAAAAEKAKAAAGAAAQASLNSVRTAVGLDDKADGDTIVATVTELAAAAKATPDKQAIVELQGQLKDVTTELNSLKETSAKERATAVIEGAIKAGRVGITPAMKDHYIARHMTDAASVEKEIEAMPVLTRTGTLPTPPKKKDGTVELNAEQQNACKVLGLKPEDFIKTLAAEAAANEETA